MVRKTADWVSRERGWGYLCPTSLTMPKLRCQVIKIKSFVRLEALVEG